MVERPRAAAFARSAGRTGGHRRDRSRSCRRRHGTLAARRSPAHHQAAFRRRLSRASHLDAAEEARLLAYERPAAPSRAERRDHRGVQKNFPRTLRAHLADLPPRASVEIWFQDEARIGQKNGIIRQWARRGTRPRQPADQRCESAYLFGAICPARGKGAALALPYADTNAMQLHLDEIGRQVAPDAQAVLLMDRAGWHTTANLDMPDNITPIFLPSRAPESNPVENIWQHLRATGFSIASSTPTTPSSMQPARLGTSSQLSRRPSPQSEPANGPTSVNLYSR